MRALFVFGLLCLVSVLAACATPQSASTSQPAIVGKWQNASTPDSAFEFQTDGTFIASDKTSAMRGKWKYVADQRVSVELQGVGTILFGTSISGDELQLEYLGGSAGTLGTVTQYKRAK